MTFEFVETSDQDRRSGYVADLTLHFLTGPLTGWRLIGWRIYETRDGHRSVLYPSRHYTTNGERRSIALLRTDRRPRQEELNARILAAYDAWVNPPIPRV